MNRRQRPIWAGAAARSWPQRLSLLLLVIFGLALIALSRPDNSWLGRVRVTAMDILAPALDMAGRPIEATRSVFDEIGDYFSLATENAELKRENAALREWQSVGRALAMQNAALKAQLNFAPAPGLRFVTAPVIAEASSGFMRSVIVYAGSTQGIAPGQAAVTGEGLAGRVLEVGEDSARILLLTDLNARIPVRFEGSRFEAMAAGDNSDRLRLDYVPEGAAPKIGDRLVTSGEGGVYPPDLPVGEIVAIDETGIRIRPFADLARLEYLRLVDFALPGLLLPAAPGE